MTKSFVLLVAFSVASLFGSTEEKLVDKLAAAQRKVEHANAASAKAGAKLEEYCASTGKKVQVKPNGLIGCVVPPPPPPAPPAPAAAAPKP
jgi:hypothetical protein